MRCQSCQENTQYSFDSCELFLNLEIFAINYIFFIHVIDCSQNVVIKTWFACM